MEVYKEQLKAFFTHVYDHPNEPVMIFYEHGAGLTWEHEVRVTGTAESYLEHDTLQEIQDAVLEVTFVDDGRARALPFGRVHGWRKPDEVNIKLFTNRFFE